MRRLAASLVVLCVGVASASAQQPAAEKNVKKSFDVASVKTAPPLDPQALLAGRQRMGMKIDAGRVDIEGWSILELLATAFKVSPARLSGPAAPNIASMLTAPRFEIHATLPAGATKDDVPEMLQSLLAERWKLAYHTEKRDQDVYALVVAKDGPKLQRSADDPAPSADAPAAGQTNRPDPIAVSGNPQTGVTIRGGNSGQPGGAFKMNVSPDGTMRMEAEKMTMEQLANALPQLVGRPVIDQTGLPGAYRIALELSRDDLMAAARAAGVNVPPAPGAGGGPADPSGSPTVFRSVENMGLKLEPKKAPVEYMVIEKLEKTPTED
jgi:uncharacterized protein (TIGR03435 family)